MEEPANRMWNKASTKKLQKYNKVQNTKVNKNPELTGLKWSGTALADIKRLLSEENGTWSQVGYLHMLQQIEPISLHAEKCHFQVFLVFSFECRLFPRISPKFYNKTQTCHFVYEQGCTNCGSLAAWLRENGVSMRK